MQPASSVPDATVAAMLAQGIARSGLTATPAAQIAAAAAMRLPRRSVPAEEALDAAAIRLADTATGGTVTALTARLRLRDLQQHGRLRRARPRPTERHSTPGRGRQFDVTA